MTRRKLIARFLNVPSLRSTKRTVALPTVAITPGNGKLMRHERDVSVWPTLFFLLIQKLSCNFSVPNE